MTKEQAIKIINDLIQNGFTNFGGSEPLSAEETDAFEIAIKALEQPTYEDCVSRMEAKIDVIPNSLYTSEQVIALLDNLSSVTPTFPKGATNGDIVKIMFPEYEETRMCRDVRYGSKEYANLEFVVDEDWWDTPYRGAEDDSN